MREGQSRSQKGPEEQIVAVDEDLSHTNLIVKTYNSTSWKAVQARLVTTDAHIMLFQEHHLSRSDQAAAAQDWLARQGWRGVLGLATGAIENASSGGVGIAVRSWLGLRLHDEVDLGARLGGASVDLPGGQTLGWFMSVYMAAGEGLSRCNLELLKTLGEKFQMVGGSFIVGGDWSMTPSQLQDVQYPEAIGATWGATEADDDGITCLTGKGEGRCIDYFLVEETYSSGVLRLQIADDTVHNPHRPVQLVLKSRLLDLRVLSSQRPLQLAVQAVDGPKPELDWSAVEELCEQLCIGGKHEESSLKEALAALDKAYDEWGKLATQTIAFAVGQPE